MTSFARSPDGLRIAYESAGEGEPVLLVHGFASSRAQNWRATGWYEALTSAGRRVIAMDCRGHGESDKPTDPALYDYMLMAGDLISVLNAEGVGSSDIMGYSMGGHLGLIILMERPEVLRRLIVGGVGETYLHGAFRSRFAIADALVEPDASRVTDPVQKTFRAFAGQPGKDRNALAACMRGERKAYSPAELSLSTRPSLIVCGENDTISGPPGPLAAALHDGRAVSIPGRDHMSAVGDKRTKEAALAFIAERN
ncbi:MAG TPA: alpha/beta fold hydrolase [Rhizomicrobium sp.]|nr:alpha/beta fold hydrolase [Rhizomicrobium sp.]